MVVCCAGSVTRQSTYNLTIQFTTNYVCPLQSFWSCGPRQVVVAACYSLPGVYSTQEPSEQRRQKLVHMMRTLKRDVSSNVQLAAFEMIGEIIYLFHDDPEGVPDELVALMLGKRLDDADSEALDSSALGPIKMLSFDSSRQPDDEPLTGILNDPDKSLIVAFNFPAVALTLAKLYSNSMLVILNSRIQIVGGRNNVDENSISVDMYSTGKGRGPLRFARPRTVGTELSRGGVQITEQTWTETDGIPLETRTVRLLAKSVGCHSSCDLLRCRVVIATTQISLPI